MFGFFTGIDEGSEYVCAHVYHSFLKVIYSLLKATT